jgi:hypothetical protein
MESKVDVDIVAFVKDSNDWIQSQGEEFELANVIQRKDVGPSLTVVECDLISIHNVSYATESSQKTNDTKDETQLGEEWTEYNSQILSQAIEGCTAVISCLGSSRGTNFYTDYLRVPLMRIWRYDVSSWCHDEGHPYYSVYLANKRILKEVEIEQQRRMVAMESERQRLRLDEELEARYSKDKKEDSSVRLARDLTRKRARFKNDIIDSAYSTSQLFEDISKTNTSMPLQSAGVRDRIKFIRVSDVNVGKNPWRIGNVLTNVFGSTVMRYEDRIEKLLKKSALLDTVIVRVGEVVKEERNVNTTSLQLSVGGVVPSPSVVGMEDVSELVAVASLTKIHDTRFSEDAMQRNHAANTKSLNYKDKSLLLPLPPPKHFIWAVRWAGQYLNPPQGLRPDGSSSAALCFVKAMQAEMARARQKQIDKMNREKLKLYHGGKQLIRLRKWLKAPWTVKPYALTSILTVYLTICAFGWMLVGKQLVESMIWIKQLDTARMITKVLSVVSSPSVVKI